VKSALKYSFLLSSVLLVASTFALSACGGEETVATTTEDAVPSGKFEFPEPAPVTRSLYVDDKLNNVRLAADLYLPEIEAGAVSFPTLLVSTRYGRRGEAYVQFTKDYLANGYAIVIFDSIGSGVSTGVREGELSDAEVSGIGVVADWISTQPWSNGQVALMGLSYSADAADLGTTIGAPSIKASVVRFAENDPYRHLFFPGGVANAMMRDLWGSAVAGNDRSVACSANAETCKDDHHVAPVDGDDNYDAARAALKDHVNNARLDVDLKGVTFWDDPLPGRPNMTLAASGTATRGDAVRKYSVPVQYWGSWFDAGTAQSALERFAFSQGVPMNVDIAITGHGAFEGADPFKPLPQTPNPEVSRQLEITGQFLSDTLSGKDVGRSIRYAVMGADVWRETDRWPPANVAMTRLYLGSESALSQAASTEDETVGYTVDFNASTGLSNRWRANLSITPDFSAWPSEDVSVLRFRSEPFTENFEIAGDPRVSLHMSSSHDDGAVFAYLAIERADGSLVYLTEGMLRFIHRAVSHASDGKVMHSYLRKDSAPMLPGEMAWIEFNQFPLAAKLSPGERIVLLLAGADKDTFERYPAYGDPQWTVDVGGDDQSFIELPLRPWAAGEASQMAHP